MKVFCSMKAARFWLVLRRRCSALVSSGREALKRTANQVRQVASGLAAQNHIEGL